MYGINNGINIELNLGNNGIRPTYGNYGGYGGYGGYAGGGFGYNAFNSMLGGMLYGGSGAYAGAGLYGGAGAYAGAGAGLYGGGYGNNMAALLGMGGFMGINGSGTMPIYDFYNAKAWDTTLATTLGRRDPVYLDTNRDGQLNVEKKNVVFDMNGDGVMDRVNEWNVKDAQLVFDANGDGQINNGREMMNEVGINGEQGKYKNGWEKARDLFDTNKDGIISSEELKKARLWTDTNGNGKVDKDELKTASELGIQTLDTNKGEFAGKQKLGDLNFNFGLGALFGGLGGYNGGFGGYGGFGGGIGGYGGFGGGIGGYGGFGGGIGGYGGFGGGIGGYGGFGGGIGGYGGFGGGIGGYGGYGGFGGGLGNLYSNLDLTTILRGLGNGTTFPYLTGGANVPDFSSAFGMTAMQGRVY